MFLGELDENICNAFTGFSIQCFSEKIFDQSLLFSKKFIFLIQYIRKLRLQLLLRPCHRNCSAGNNWTVMIKLIITGKIYGDGCFRGIISDVDGWLSKHAQL